MVEALTYDPAPGDRYDYDLHASRFTGDPAMAGSAIERAAQLPGLMASTHWQDRVRAEAILSSLTRSVLLPDSVPAIVELEASPRLNREPRPLHPYDPARHVWVAHPDADVLAELLPGYQAMWDEYTSQWGPASRRLFGVQEVTGAHVRKLRTEGSTADDILRSTANTHSMRLPQRLAGEGR